jgi:hypothetical protein
MSILGNAVTDNGPGQGGSGGVMPDSDTSTAFQQGGTGQPVQVGITQAAPTPPQQPTTPAAPQAPSRLQKILGAVASVATTGLSGIPDRGRPSFVSGLGEGARAEQAAQAQQQAIKFKTFDDQVRMAELTNQSLKLQNDTQAQTDAHIKAEIDNRALANEYGIDYDTISNHGPAVMDHLIAKTAASGTASVPPGINVSADGQNIYIPKDNDQTREGQKSMYNALAPALGLPGLPQGAAFVPPRLMNMLTNKVHGFTITGEAPKHEELPGMIGAAQAQRDNLAKNGGTPAQLTALDNMIGIYKANLDALDKHANDLKAQGKQAELDVENNPANQAAAAKGAGLKKGAEEKAAFPYQLELAKEKAANAGAGKPGSVVGFDPQSNQRVVVNSNDPKAGSLQQSAKVTPQQLDQWGTSQNQFANVQLAVSRYDQAARTFAQSGKPGDIVGINSALNQSGIGDIKIGEWGVKVPGFSSLAEASSRVANSQAFKSLSPAGQDLVDKYFRMMSSIPEYQKAATGIGRTNKEMLDLELKNIPDPTMPPSIISNRLGSFQEALSSNASRVPRIQGVPHYQDVQQHYQPQAQQPQAQQPQAPSASLGSNLGSWVSGLQPSR